MVLSSNNQLMQPSEDTVKDVVGNLETNQQKASHTEFEKPISKDTEKYMTLNKLTSLNKSKFSSITEKEDTGALDTKTRSMSSASLDDKILNNNNQNK